MCRSLFQALEKKVMNKIDKILVPVYHQKTGNLQIYLCQVVITTTKKKNKASSHPFLTIIPFSLRAISVLSLKCQELATCPSSPKFSTRVMC